MYPVKKKSFYDIDYKKLPHKIYNDYFKNVLETQGDTLQDFRE